MPDQGSGSLLLTGSTTTSGRAWTDTGVASQDRQLKHRAVRATRPVPAPPELVKILRRHIAEYGPGQDGRLFVTRTGRAGVPLAGPYGTPIDMGVVYRIWKAARAEAPTQEQVASPPARRPYDLRHAAVSLWLNHPRRSPSGRPQRQRPAARLRAMRLRPAGRRDPGDPARPPSGGSAMNVAGETETLGRIRREQP